MPWLTPSVRRFRCIGWINPAADIGLTNIAICDNLHYMVPDFAGEVFYTPEQVAKKLQLSLTTLYNLIKSREIPSVRIGKSFRIPQSELLGILGRRSPIIPAIATDFVAQVRRSALKTHVADIILFGSYARGEPRADSDVDLLLIYSHMDEQMQHHLSALEEDVSAAHGYQGELQVMKKSVLEWKALTAHAAGLYRTIAKEGVSLWKQ